MMKWIIISGLVFLFSCAKEVRQQKRLQGNWTINEVRIEDGEGFLFYDSLATGSFEFAANQLNGKANYSYSYFGLYDVTDSVQFEQQPYSLAQKGSVLRIARSTDTLEAKIIVLTNKHLTFEYYDYLQYRLKRFSCSKQ